MFKKSFDDFEDPVLYNDYLEEVEIFVEELTNLKNESEIRQALNSKKRDMESLLNYIKPARKTISKFEYKVDNIRDIRMYDQKIKLPSLFLKYNNSCGLTRDTVMSYAVDYIEM